MHRTYWVNARLDGKHNRLRAKLHRCYSIDNIWWAYVFDLRFGEHEILCEFTGYSLDFQILDKSAASLLDLKDSLKIDLIQVMISEVKF